MSDHIICPSCGRTLNDTEWVTDTYFIVQGRFYCDELCGKRARIRTYEELTHDE